MSTKNKMLIYLINTLFTLSHLITMSSFTEVSLVYCKGKDWSSLIAFCQGNDGQLIHKKSKWLFFLKSIGSSISFKVNDKAPKIILIMGGMQKVIQLGISSKEISAKTFFAKTWEIRSYKELDTQLTQYIFGHCIYTLLVTKPSYVILYAQVYPKWK